MSETNIEWDLLRGRRLGVMKTAAKRVGLTLEDYRARLDGGERWCTACKAWHPRGEFVPDASRGFGIQATCKAVARIRGRGRSRDLLKNAARSRVHYAVRRGRLPGPNTLPCTDCGHLWFPGELRHEYDHHLGYTADHHLSVETVCTPCHRKREAARG